MITLIGLIFLIYFSYLDLKHSQVGNKPIFAMFLVGLGISIFYYNILAVAFSFAFMSISAYILWKYKTIGGADMKILSCLPLFMSNFNELFYFLIVLMIFGTIYGLIMKSQNKKEVVFIPIITLTYLITKFIFFSFFFFSLPFVSPFI